MEVSTKKLVFAFGIVFLLGVMFAIINGYYTQEENESLPLIVYAISFVSLVSGIFISLLFQSKINKIHLNRVLNILPKEQGLIIKSLIENQGSLEQNKIVAFTGLNKVRVSRIIKDLEFRGIVKKTDLGNTNLVVLKV